VQPSIRRPITLRFKGDPGGANLNRVCGWLAMEACGRAGKGSKNELLSGDASVGNVRSLLAGEVDVAVITPAAWAVMAVRGNGMYEGEPAQQLCALGTVEHHDGLILAIDRRTGVDSIAAWRERQSPLRVALEPNDGTNQNGFASEAVLAEHGITPELIEAWGGSVTRAPLSRILRMMAEQKVDAVVSEAITTDFWHEAAESVELNFIDYEPDALKRLEDRYGWPAMTLEPNFFRGQTGSVQTLGMRDFGVLTTTSLPDDVARLLAWCLVNTHAWFTRLTNYDYAPYSRRAIASPLDPKHLASAPIELHPAARAYYEESLG
jgi:uncharacterized protein